jgi:hypothetical protein
MRHAWVAFALLGCASDALPPPDVALYVGQEQTAWADDPQAKRIRVDLVQADGTRTPLADTDAPPPVKVDDTKQPAIIPIQEQHFDRPAVASFTATGVDASGNAVLRGNSIFFGMTQIYAVRIPIFVGRVQSFARPISALNLRHLRPVVNTVYELLIAAGGDAIPGQDPAVPEFFDAAVWQTVSSQPPLPRAPKTLASVGTRLLVVDDMGATWLDLSKNTTEELAATDPPLDFSLVAGGDTLERPGGLRYIVGATRQEGAPTDKVLHIGENRAPSILTLSAPRAGAAAVFVGTNLVVAGGSATAAMAEVLASGDTKFNALPYPPDATAGLGLAALDDKTALVVGGTDPMSGAASPMRTLDVTCAASCTPGDVGTLPLPLTRTKVFVVSPTQVVVVGETDEAGLTGVVHAFSIDPSQPPPFEPHEIALKVPRAKATAGILPNGQLGIVGGQLLDGTDASAKSIEIFIP